MDPSLPTDARALSGKRCSKCYEEKPIDQYNKKACSPDGLRASCRECQRLATRAYYEANKAPLAERQRAYRKRNPELARRLSRENQRRRRKLGKGSPSDRQSIANWWAANPGKRREYWRRHWENPKARISGAVRAAIRSEIRRGSKRRPTFDLLGYTPAQLMAHLESHFTPGMSWDNFGRGGWHIDHMVPLSAFNYESPEHIDFQRAWALSNLRPLWERDNLSKGAKLAAPFQPCLQI